MSALFHLRSLQALEMAVRAGSFAAAADELGITPAAVGQRVKALEDFLGLELLVRGRSGIRPTPELQQALPALHRAFELIAAAADELEVQRGHDINIAAQSDVVELWLTARLARFREEHPNIRFCVNGEGDAPLRLGRADCEITFGPKPDDPATDLLFRDYVLPVTSPINVERLARTEQASRLEGFPLLHLDFYKDDPAGLSWPDWVRVNHVRRSAPERGIRFQRVVAALDAVAADAGLTLCGMALAADALNNGKLAYPYSVASGRWCGHSLYARYRPDTAERPHIRRFRAWLAREGEATAAWLTEEVESATRPGYIGPYAENFPSRRTRSRSTLTGAERS